MICSAKANPALLNYTWYRENRGQLQQFQTGFNLTLSVTNRGHSGWYHCVAQNKHGKQNTSVMLDIQCEYKGSPVTCSCQQHYNILFFWFKHFQMPLRYPPQRVTKHNKLYVCVRLMGIPLLKWSGFYLDVPSLTLVPYLSARSVWARQTWRAMSPYFNPPHSTTFCSVSAPTLVALPVQSFNWLHLLKRLQVRSLF